MRTAVIELNDTGIAVYCGERLMLESPGYAIVDRDSLVVGTEAYEQAHLHPRQTHNRFWDQLGLEPLAMPVARVRHHADLAYAHLAHIWEQIKAEVQEIVFAMPGSFGREQLGLLLGIAKACGMPVVGLVDAAVAASSEAAGPCRTIFHLDIQLHRVVLTQLHRDTRLMRSGLQQLTQTGLVSLREGWANIIADTFVRMTRFDPMHRAQSEQQLHDALSGWLVGLAGEPTIGVELRAEGRSYTVNLAREQLSRAAAGIYQQIVQLIRASATAGDPVALHLSHRFEALPGFVDALTALGDCEIIRLAPASAAQGVLKHQALIRSANDSVNLITALPAHEPQPSQAEAPAALTMATHVLYRARAYRINEYPLVVGTQIPADVRGLSLAGSLHGVSRRHCSIYAVDRQARLDDHSTYGTFVNGQRVNGSTPLQVGDKIRIGTPGVELQLIAVVQPNGA